MSKRAIPVELRLYSWPHYAAVARMVRYETLNYDDVKPYVEELERHFGADKIREAVLDVCRVNWNTKPVTIELRPEVRKHCFQLLGPSPEQEDEFYRHPGGTPRQRPPRKVPDALAFTAGGKTVAENEERAKGKSSKRSEETPDLKVFEPAKNGKGADVAEPAKAPPAESTKPEPDNPLTRLSDERLRKRYRHARSALRFHGKDSPASDEVRKSLSEIVEELRRRGIEVPGGRFSQ